MTVWNPRSDGRPVVLHVIDTLSSGGTERMLVTLLTQFDARTVRHVVVTMRDAGAGAASLPDHVACCALGLRGSSRRAFARLARVARAWDAAVIHARNTGCWWDAAIAALITPGAQAVLGFHGLDRVDGLNHRIRRLARWATHRGARFTSVSNDGRRLLRDELGVPFGRTVVLRSGVDVERFRPFGAEERRAARDRFGVPRDVSVFGAVGSLTPIKRFDLLLDAFAASSARRENGHLVIAGDGPLRDTLRRRAVGLGLAEQVHFVGAVNDVRDVLACVDAFVCCSDFEGVSNALLEAMACGLPVITTSVGDHPEIVDANSAGLVVEAGSVRELTGAMDQLARDAESRSKMGRTACKVANGWTLENSAREYDRYYTSLLDGTNASLVGSPIATDREGPTYWPQAI